MNIYKSGLFTYIAGDSLIGRPVVLTMNKVVTEPVVGQGGKVEEKLILYFKETKKGLILNKTNAKRIAKLYGGETDSWADKVVELYTEEVKAFGETHNAVRIREAQQVKQAQKSKAQAAASTPQERRGRLKENGNLLHGQSELPIGEDSDTDPLCR